MVLIGIKSIRGFIRNASGNTIIGARIFRLNIGWTNNHFGANGAQGPNLFIRHFVRHNKNAFITTDCGDKSQTHTRISAGGFDNSAARLDGAIFLCIINNIDADSVLHGAAGVQIFAFDVDLRFGVAAHGIELDHGGISHSIENIRVRSGH